MVKNNGINAIYQLGINERVFPKELSWNERLIYAKNAGFDSFEISVDGSDAGIAKLDDMNSKLIEVENAKNKSGISIGSISLSALRRFSLGSTDDTIRKRSMDIAIKSIGIASALGCRVVQIAGGDVFYEESTIETKKFFIENLKKIASYAAAEGVLIGIEPMEMEMMDNVSKTMAYVDRLCSPYLGIYPDTSGLTISAKKTSSDVMLDLEKGKGHILALHLQDYIEGEKGFTSIGTGMVDYISFLKKAKRLGVHRFVIEYASSLKREDLWKIEYECKKIKEKLDM